MKWFEGDIPSAIRLAKENKAIFVVYISGKDELSNEMDTTWSDSDVSSLCEQNGCVALRLQANSDTCAQFSMIYPVVCVPSTFFIGENGVPLEVTGGSLRPSEFLQKIKHVLELHKAQLDDSSLSAASKVSSEQGAAAAAASTPEGAAPSSPNEGTSQASAESWSDTEKEEASSSPDKPLDEKIERVLSSPRAKELLAIKRQEKLQKAKEEERKKELERRRIGQDVVKLKQWQQMQERKHDVEEMMKEKEERRREKERILQELARDREEKVTTDTSNTLPNAVDGQMSNLDETVQREADPLMEQLIRLRAERSAQYHQNAEEKDKKHREREKRKSEAQMQFEAKKQRGCEILKEQLISDREEKKARFQAQKEERERATEEQKKKKLQAEQSAMEKADAAKMERARLQFRLPDGSAITNQFSSSDTMQMARDFVSEKVGNSLGQFKLTTTYPKRQFQDDDLPKTLLELGLAPSAVLIVVPGSKRTLARLRGSPSNHAVSRQDGSTNSLLMTLLAPLLVVWNFLCALLLGAPSEPRGAQVQARQETSTPPSENSEPSTSHDRERPKSSYGLRKRQEGNIMRLSAIRDDEDDDTATWNGNSTQQM